MTGLVFFILIKECHFVIFQCAVYTFEAVERDKLKVTDQYYSQLATEHTVAPDTLMTAALPNPAVPIKLTGRSLGLSMVSCAISRLVRF